MHTILSYLLVVTAIIIVTGGIVAFVAIRNAPEGYEDENGFTGITKGDEVLLNEYAKNVKTPPLRKMSLGV